MINWQDLCELARKVRKMAPWTWMSEADIFGVEMAAGQDPVFVSIMGALGEHLAVAVYPNLEALSLFWALQNEDHVDPSMILEIPQIQLSFEDRELLNKEDHAVLKDLGLKFRGKNAWPRFRTYQAGFVPRLPTADEAELLQIALEQLLKVAPAFRQERERAQPEDPNVYVIRTRGHDKIWRDEFRQIHLTPSRRVDTMPGADEIRRGRALPKVANGIEIDFFMVPAPVLTGRPHPFFPYILLMVESKSGAICGQQLLSVDTSLNDMLRRVPHEMLGQLEQMGIRPSTISVRQGRMEDLLRPWCECLGIRLDVRQRLEQLDQAKGALREYLSSG